MTAILSRVRWGDGAETRIRLDSAQRQGIACAACGLQDGRPMRPVGRIIGVGQVVAHPVCARGRRHMRVISQNHSVAS